ncbi:hypothetical protein Dimus_005326 [Dionaea muscipula]
MPCSLSWNDDLHRVFESIDQNGDGMVSLEELNWLLDRTGIDTCSLEELKSLISKPAGLDFDEFCYLYESLLLKRRQKRVEAEESKEPSDGCCSYKEEEEEEERVLYEAFEVFDLNGDGFISPDEIESMLLRLGLWNIGMDCERIMHQYDTNSDGFVDFEEFKRMILA